MSFFSNLPAAALRSARTLFRVALFVRRVLVLKPFFRASVCMSLASNSQAVSSPDHPLYCLGLTAFSPMWREAALGITEGCNLLFRIGPESRRPKGRRIAGVKRSNIQFGEK